MAIPKFQIDPPPNPIPDFNSLSLTTSKATTRILIDELQGTDPQRAMKLEKQADAYKAAARANMMHVLKEGTDDPQLQSKRVRAAQKFFAHKSDLLEEDGFAWLSKGISRKEFDISPYEIPGKNVLRHPFPGFTAAQDGVWPGYDHPEHMKEYPFLKKYGGLIEFLETHGVLFNLPETFARYGGVFVPHPYAGLELNQRLREHLSHCDVLFHTAPKVRLDTTKEELDLILSYYEDDFVAVVVDPGGTVLGTVGREDSEGHGPKTKVKNFINKKWNEAPRVDFTGKKAFEYMEQKDIDHMIRVHPEFGPRIVTKTTAALSHFLPPFQHKGGLGSIAYLRISDLEESQTLLDTLSNSGDGIPGAIIETAHADTEYMLKVFRTFRRRYQDLFLITGTVIDPYAVDEFMLQVEQASGLREDADALKLGIAEGHACRTASTGVRLTNAYAAMLCGASIWGKGTTVVDGWGYPDEFILGLSAHAARARQGGGAIVGRRESGNPWLRRGGKRGKLYRGMAGADVRADVLKQRPTTLEERMEAAAHLHSEGAEEFIPERFPSTVGRMMLQNKFLLQSTFSYNGVRKQLEEPAMHQFQRRAKWYIVPQRKNG